MPLVICTPSEKVNRFLRFQTLAALLGPAAVRAAEPVVVFPPPIVIPPGPWPVTNDKLGSNGTNDDGSRLYAAREYPNVNMLTMRGDRMCVSCTLATWLRSVE